MSAGSIGRVRILIVDDNIDTQENLKKMLYFEPGIEVVGVAGGCREGIQKAKELRPNVVLMDVNMPEIDGIRATELLRAEMPGISVIMMSVQSEQEYLRRAMIAGASDYLVKPFAGDDLVSSIRMAHGREGLRQNFVAQSQVPAAGPVSQPQAVAQIKQAKIISIFSPKGGVGKTTVAVNLASALKTVTEGRVALLDGSFLFGDVGVMLNLMTKKSIADLVSHIDELDAELIEEVMFTHVLGISVLLSPPRPEMAELVTAKHVNTILAKLRTMYDYIVIDTNPSFQEVMLAILDASDKIITISTPEVSSLKNMKLFWETTDALGYPQGKLLLVINRASSAGGITIEEIQSNLNQKVACAIVNDWKLATFAVNSGVPFIMSNKESQLSKDIMTLADLVVGQEDVKQREVSAKPKGFGGRLNLFRWGS